MNAADGIKDNGRNIIPDGLCGPDVTISVLTCGRPGRRVNLERCWVRKTRQPLLALKMEGAARERAASRNQKRQENRFSPESLQKEQSPANTLALTQ